MTTELKDEVLLVYYTLLAWEDNEGITLFSTFENSEESVFMLMTVLLANKTQNPPNILIDPNGWASFILTQFVDFADDFGINNIKSIIKNNDRIAIADSVESRLQDDPSTWSIDRLKPTQLKINELLNSFSTPEFAD